MKKIIKNVLVLILLALSVACMCAAFSACKKSGDDDNTDNINYNDVKIVFLEENDFNKGDFDESSIVTELNSKLGEKWYMIADFDIVAPNNNDGRQTVTASVKIQPAQAVKATIQDAETCDVSEETKDDITELTATYKIPEKANSSRNMRLVIKLDALKASEVYIDTVFDSELQAVKTEKIEMTACFGFTRGLKYSSNAIIGCDKDLSGDLTELEPLMVNHEYINLTSIDSKAFYNCSGLTGITIPECVTSIGSYAFSGCSGLASITIPYSVTSIGVGAFSGCSGLTSMTLPFVGASKDGVDNTHFGYVFGASYYVSNSANVPDLLKEVVITGDTTINGYAFYNCSRLKSITIGNNVTSIGVGAFSGCSELTSITMPNSIKSVGINAFNGCNKLQYNEYDKGLYLGNDTNKYLVIVKVKSKDITSCALNNNVKIISNSFSECSSLTGITIPDSVTSIGANAFYKCTELTSVTIGNNVTCIGDGAFKQCNKLTSLIFPDSVKIIGDESFYGCSKLASLTIPDNVISIDSDAFRSCSGLTSLTLGKSVTSIGEYAFYGCNKLTSITIPDNVTIIGKGAFSGCSGLTSITLPFVGASKNNISNTHFGYIFGASGYDYNSTYVPALLKEVIITENAISIDANAFRSCKELTNVTIGKGVTSIGGNAFSYCSGLTNITIPASVTDIGGYVFSSCNKLVSIDYDGTKDRWWTIKKNTYWNSGAGNYTVHCTDGNLTKAES